MCSIRLLLIIPLVLATAAPVLAQGTQQGSRYRSQSQNTVTAPRNPVATPPSNNPFRNPIGHGVPPAVSANPDSNNRTNVR